MSVKPAGVVRKVEEAEPDLLRDASWLYSYADLITQMLLFTILSVTLLGLKEFQEPTDQPAPLPEESQKSKLEEMRDKLQSYAKDSGLEGAMAVDQSADRLVIRLESRLLFRAGRAELGTKARGVVQGLAKMVKEMRSHIRVEGHTDDVPIHTAQFPSNWELSTARAISVVQALEEEGFSPNHLSAAGYGEFHPIVPNDSAEHRGLNRRVEIVIIGGTETSTST